MLEFYIKTSLSKPPTYPSIDFYYAIQEPRWDFYHPFNISLLKKMNPWNIKGSKKQMGKSLSLID